MMASDAGTRRDQPDIAHYLLPWFDVHGRRHLPWQQDKTPYRVWISEIMLQQTQVATVIPYYERFMQRFPSLPVLADAPEDEVLAHWSGLGYYSRARNLHRSACIAVREHGGELPQDMDQLVQLPGIGPSTAGAILSLASGQHHAILDGNVKRVLARYHAVPGWPGKSTVLKRLWEIARSETPAARTADYNQAMMDLGAMVCTARNPGCSACPLSAGCKALRQADPLDFPGKKPRKVLPEKSTVMLLLQQDNGDILLQKRPPSGIWGGLWSLPEVANTEAIAQWLTQSGLEATGGAQAYARFRHTFSHYHLDIEVQTLTVSIVDTSVLETAERVWYKGVQLPGGVAAPVSRILNGVKGELL